MSTFQGPCLRLLRYEVVWEGSCRRRLVLLTFLGLLTVALQARQADSALLGSRNHTAAPQGNNNGLAAMENRSDLNHSESSVAFGGGELNVAAHNRSLSPSEMFRDARAQHPRPTGLIDLFEWVLVFILIAPGSFPAFSCIALACIGFWRRRYASYWSQGNQPLGPSPSVASTAEPLAEPPLWDPAKSRRRIRTANIAPGQQDDADVCTLPVGVGIAPSTANGAGADCATSASFHAE
jgi:hypothetical protein